MTSVNDDGDDSNIVEFPTTDAERRAQRKAKQDREKQRLINIFIDEVGGDQALFHTPDGVAYADLIIAGHRETWPVRSKQFRHAYLQYLRRQVDRLIDQESVLAPLVKSGMSKAAINTAIDDFETRAICSPTVREAYIRTAGWRRNFHRSLQRCLAGCSHHERRLERSRIPAGAIPAHQGNAAASIP